MRLFFLFVGVAAGPPYATLPSFSKTASFQLHDGKQMPVMGLGVYMSNPGAETENAVPSAELQLGGVGWACVNVLRRD